MTVVAWDGETLAADKRCGTELPKTVTKIRRAKNGALIGCTGTAGGDQELMAWYDAGADVKTFPPRHLDSGTSSEMIVIEPGGVIKIYSEWAYPYTVEHTRHAIGSGSDFAMAAMHLGKSAREAVEVAIALTATCGNGIDAIPLVRDRLTELQSAAVAEMDRVLGYSL